MAKAKSKTSSEVPTPQRLLYSREETGHLLGGVCSMSLFRLEKRGLLKPIRLTPNQHGRVYYDAKQVKRLVQGSASDAQ